jgi:hypothetical protein
MTPEEMSAVSGLSDEQFRGRVHEILTRELGPDGYRRFLRLFGEGAGDYTRDRHEWLGGTTVEEIIKDIKSRRGTAA